MNRTRVHLIRHGQVEGHEQKRYNGQADVALTALGRAQLAQVAERLGTKPLQAVYSSDLGRCRYGAELIAAHHQLAPVFSDRLRELHIGAWEGMTWAELQSRSPDQWQARLADIVNYRVPGGESLRQMAERVRGALAKILARHAGEEIALVGHGGVNRVILLDAIGAPLEQLFNIEQDYGCLNLIDYYADGYRVVKLLNG